MKKVYFMAFAATVAMAMTSCSSEDLTAGTGTSNNEATAINFSTYLGRNVESRASETTTANIKTSGFGVFASYTSAEWSSSATSNFMFNQQVTNSEDKWTYSPVKYWTSEGKFSFFAYAPYATTENGIATSSEKTDTGEPVLKITVPTDAPSKMIDFVAGKAMNQAYSSTTDGTVNFSLKHEMTRVAFKATKAEGIDAATSVKVIGIKLTSKKLYKEATYKFASTADANGTWTAKELSADNSITLNGLSLTNDTQSDYLYLIPVKDLTAADATAEITYEVTTTDSNLNGGSVTTTGKKTVNLPVSTLQQGKSYLFTLSIGLNEIKLSATVADDWGTDNNQTITVGAN